ncbi:MULTISPECIES: hypothetical protein [Pseudomonas]|uniref:hypothetical protein n=1 Tax=Pseudomonas TaxID=286 RepID=UPI000CD51FE5|nr:MULTISPECIES: hypothetical protein [Pseudomonas]RBH55914.1 hypothetical protein C3F00_017760 [Pseudomonas sp. MWU13-2860]
MDTQPASPFTAFAYPRVQAMPWRKVPIPDEDQEPLSETPGNEDDHQVPQTWKHPDDGKSLSELDEELPLKP